MAVESPEEKMLVGLNFWWRPKKPRKNFRQTTFLMRTCNEQLD